MKALFYIAVGATGYGIANGDIDAVAIFTAATDFTATTIIPNVVYLIQQIGGLF